MAGAVRTLDALAAVPGLIATAGGREPLLPTGDLTEDECPERLAEEAVDRLGRVDVLINDAGGSRPLSASDDEDDWHEGGRLSSDAVRRLGDALIPSMAARGWGRVANVTGAIVGKALNAAAPAKAATESWSRAAAAHFAASGVTVNRVAPGRITAGRS